MGGGDWQLYPIVYGMDDGDLLYSTGSSAPYSVITYVGNGSEKERICVCLCVTVSLSCTAQINTTWQINSMSITFLKNEKKNKPCNPKLIIRKIPDKPRLWDILQGNLTSAPLDSQDGKRKKGLKS